MNNIELQQNWEDDGLHEECGVFGMYDLDGNDIASSIYYGLFALQHRGHAKVAQKGFQKYHIYFTLFAKPKGCFTKIFKKDSF